MKQTLYPKTQRVSPTKMRISEKLDGSNIGFFRENDELYIAQRNNIWSLKEINAMTNKDELYTHLTEWLKEHGEHLKEVLYDNACIFGEWIGIHGKYPDLKNRFQMFAKANVTMLINSEFDINNIYYNRDLFIYPFREQTIPDYISIVPEVAEVNEISIDILNSLYEAYTNRVGRAVEGLIVVYNNDSIKKYVRMKNGSLENHFWR